jgi:F0F1-type ATP synthase membrane subunit b/b'
MIIVLKKIGVFVKHYWYIPLLALAAILLFIFGRGGQALELYKRMRGNYSEEIKKLQEQTEQERQEKEAALKKYNEVLSQLEKQYSEQSKKLKDEEKKQVKEIIEQYKNDAEGMTQQLAQEFGFVYQKR